MVLGGTHPSLLPPTLRWVVVVGLLPASAVVLIDSLSALLPACLPTYMLGGPFLVPLHGSVEEGCLVPSTARTFIYLGEAAACYPSGNRKAGKLTSSLHAYPTCLPTLQNCAPAFSCNGVS